MMRNSTAKTGTKGWKNHEDSEEEGIRRELLKLAEENRLLKENITEMQKQIYEGYKRIKELTDEKDSLIAKHSADDGIVSSSSGGRQIRSWSFWNGPRSL